MRTVLRKIRHKSRQYHHHRHFSLPFLFGFLEDALVYLRLIYCFFQLSYGVVNSSVLCLLTSGINSLYFCSVCVHTYSRHGTLLEVRGHPVFWGLNSGRWAWQHLFTREHLTRPQIYFGDQETEDPGLASFHLTQWYDAHYLPLCCAKPRRTHIYTWGCLSCFIPLSTLFLPSLSF